MTRTAISPRFATSTVSNMRRTLEACGRTGRQVGPRERWTKKFGGPSEKCKVHLGVSTRSGSTKNGASARAPAPSPPALASPPVSWVRTLAHESFGHELVTLPYDGHSNGFTGLVRPDQAPRATHRFNLSISHLEDHVTRDEAQGGVLVHLHDQDASLHPEICPQLGVELYEFHSFIRLSAVCEVEHLGDVH